MEKITHGNISTTQIVTNLWIAKTKTLEPLKSEIEIKGISEHNAYEKLMKFLQSTKVPERIESLENGNKIYHFKSKNNESI